MLAPESVKLPEPDFTREPVPLITPAEVVSKLLASVNATAAPELLLKVKFPAKLRKVAAVTALPNVNEPAVIWTEPALASAWPVPNCRVPAEITTLPLSVLTAFNITNPVVSLVNAPEPANTEATEPPCKVKPLAVKVPPVMLPPLKVTAPTVWDVVPSPNSPAVTLTDPLESAPLSPKVSVPAFTIVPPP